MQTDNSHFIDALKQRAKQTNHRYLLVISGERDWCYKTIEKQISIGSFSSQWWITDTELPERNSIVASKCQQLLGHEAELVVFDAYAGFDPDAFGAVSGIVCGGGLLILLAPGLSDWARYPDPDYQRLCVHPFKPEQISGRFLQRFIALLQQSTKSEAGVFVICQGDTEPGKFPSPPNIFSSNIAPPNDVVPVEDRFLEQKKLIDQIIHVATGHRRRPLVVNSDRGRGKSAAMGLAAAQLLKLGKQSIIVTAPRLEAVSSVFRHAAHALSVTRKRNALEFENRVIQFIPPDELLRSQPDTDLLMVDEAAGIPSPLLAALLKRYSRVVFATTTHGYEGSGRGFVIRFKQTLDQITPQWKQATLNTPIRWSANDPVEQFVFNALLLKADVDDEGLADLISAEQCAIRLIDRDELLTNPALLEQTFGLLVAAHYKTSPSDLRSLLDGPSISVYIMEYRNKMVGACLVAREGGIHAELAELIARGERRVRGHLIPQSLISHIGLPEAAALVGGRIMRIAIHPKMQRNGFGRALMKSVISHSREQGLHYIASSFGATAELLHFWQACGITPIRVGLSREASSGMHSVLVISSLDKQSASVVEQAIAIFWQQFPLMLTDQYRDLEPELIAVLMAGKGSEQREAVGWAELTPHDWQMLQSFADKQRVYDVCSVAIWKMGLQLLANATISSQVDEGLKKTLILRVLQHQDWQSVAYRTGLSGRKQVTESIRQLVQFWLDNSR